MTYWHFAAMENGTPIMRDGTRIEVGKRYTVDTAVMCCSGFHGSVRIMDALQYARGPWVSRRDIAGIIKDNDKVCGTSCVHTIGIDATDVLRKFSRMCALDVLHLWDAPPIVVRYLKTGDESIRVAAWDAVWNAAAAWNSTRAAEWNAGRTTTWATTWDAMPAAGWNAEASEAAHTAMTMAWDAAWSATRDDVRVASRIAAWTAASAAAWDAVWNVARTEAAADEAPDAKRTAASDAKIASASAAVWNAATNAWRKKQNTRLTRMINRALRETR